MRTRMHVMTALLAGLTLAPAAQVQAVEGTARFGSQWWTQDAPEAEYQRFRDVPRGGFLETFVLREWNGRQAFWIGGANAIRDDQRYGLGWANGARMRVDIGYTQIPHRFSFVGRSPYAEVLPGQFRLPDSLQARNQRASNAGFIANMLDELGRAPRVENEFRTDITSARLRMRPAPGLTFEVKGVNRNRAGHKPYGVSFGFSNAVEVLEPIRQNMQEGDVRMNLARNRMVVQAGVGVSLFRNDVSTLWVDNPRVGFDAAAGARQTALDMYPDNRAYRGSLAFNLALPRYSALSATVQFAQLTQDDKWLPFTTNTTLAQSRLDSLPGRSTDAKANRTTLDLRLVSRGFGKVTVTPRFHIDKYDDKTPHHEFSGFSPYDASFTAEDLVRREWSSDRSVLGVDAAARLTSRVTLGALAEYRKRSRTSREVEDDAETVLGARLGFSITDAVMLEGAYRRADRELDKFHEDEYRNEVGAFIEQPSLRRYDVSDRRQDAASGALSWALGDHVQTTARYEYLRNDYLHSQLGLRDEKQQGINVESVLDLGRVDLSGGYGFAQLKSDQKSRESGAALSLTDSASWTADIKDQNVFVFAGANAQLRPRLNLVGDYTFSRDLARYDLTNFARTAVDLPSTFYRRHEVVVDLVWQALTATNVTARYGFDSWDIDDFATQNQPLLFPVTGASTALFLGNNMLDYHAHRVALLVSTRF